MACSHPNARFLPCKAADRFPGVWVCDDCDCPAMNFDPTGKFKIRYLDRPGRTQTKELPEFKASKA